MLKWQLSCWRKARLWLQDNMHAIQFCLWCWFGMRVARKAGDTFVTHVFIVNTFLRAAGADPQALTRSGQTPAEVAKNDAWDTESIAKEHQRATNKHFVCKPYWASFNISLTPSHLNREIHYHWADVSIPAACRSEAVRLMLQKAEGETAEAADGPPKKKAKRRAACMTNFKSLHPQDFQAKKMRNYQLNINNAVDKASSRVILKVGAQSVLRNLTRNMKEAAWVTSRRLQHQHCKELLKKDVKSSSSPVALQDKK